MQSFPKLIPFDSIGSKAEGFLCVASFKRNLPFKPIRTFWTYATPENVSRGRHAHYDTSMVLIALSGSIKIITECLNGEKKEFQINKASEGLFIPKLCWHEMWYSTDAIQLVVASTEYNENDYIRNYKTFQQLQAGNRS